MSFDKYLSEGCTNIIKETIPVMKHLTNWYKKANKKLLKEESLVFYE